jgi:hypothetical protein
VRGFKLAEIQTSIAQPNILKIIFVWRTDVFSPLDIISAYFRNDERILEILYVFYNSSYTY